MSAKVIHFFNYLEYEDLESLKFKFNEPNKDNDTGIYSSNLVEPIHFYLPKSEIIEVYQDDFGINKITYRVDMEEHEELLQFCDNLDSLCINLACINSSKWFGKQINADILIKYLNSVYNISEDDTITIDVDISDMNYLDKLSEYNNNDNMNLLITISAIEFFKQTFRIKLELNSILEGVPNDSNGADSDLEMDFNQMLENSSNQQNITESNKEKDTDNIVKNENEDALENKQQPKIENEKVQIKEKLISSQVINNETINELANVDTTNLEDKQNITSDDFNDTISKETINEIESLISQKKIEKQKFLLNAERARRASQNLVDKASKLDVEISDYQNKLNSISQNI